MAVVALLICGGECCLICGVDALLHGRIGFGAHFSQGGVFDAPLLDAHVYDDRREGGEGEVTHRLSDEQDEDER